MDYGELIQSQSSQDDLILLNAVLSLVDAAREHGLQPAPVMATLCHAVGRILSMTGEPFDQNVMHMFSTNMRVGYQEGFKTLQVEGNA